MVLTIDIVRTSSVDVAFVDYDGVRFHMSTPEKKTVLLLSMHIRCWDELVSYGALDILAREYGSLLRQTTEPDYNVSLEIDLEQIPTTPGAHHATAISLDHCFTDQAQRSKNRSLNPSLCSSEMPWLHRLSEDFRSRSL